MLSFGSKGKYQLTPTSVVLFPIKIDWNVGKNNVLYIESERIPYPQKSVNTLACFSVIRFYIFHFVASFSAYPPSSFFLG